MAGQIAGVMRVRDVTNFVSIGQRLRRRDGRRSGAVAPERCLAIPGVLPEQYPAAMSIFDIVFDPPGTSAVAARAQPAALAGGGAPGASRSSATRGSTRHRGRRDRLPRAPTGRRGARRSCASSTTRCCARPSAARARRAVERAPLDGGGRAAVAARVRGGRRHEGRRGSPTRSSAAGGAELTAGGVPRRGAARASRWSTARRTRSSGSPAATSPASTTASPIRRETVDALAGKPALRYWHDLARPGGPATRRSCRWAPEHATSVFTSPLHRDRFPHRVAGEPHADPARDRPRALRRAGARKRRAAPAGSARRSTPARACCRPSSGPRRTSRSTSGASRRRSPESARIRAKGPSRPTHVPTILRLYRRFVFLPTTVEPFGRAVVEAWAAGCELIVNRNVGALHWLEHPDGARDRGAPTSGAWSARSRVRLKLLLHTNAPWSPSGYGQQVALFAPRLAEHTDVAISAFHGLANAPLDFGRPDDLPGQRRAAGATTSCARTPSATSAACAAGSCSPWSTSSCSSRRSGAG